MFGALAARTAGFFVGKVNLTLLVFLALCVSHVFLDRILMKQRNPSKLCNHFHYCAKLIHFCI